jgi:DHA2 family multidrug resistance protein
VSTLMKFINRNHIERKSESAGNQAKKSEVTTHPAYAVVGVLLGALVSVFTGRLLSIGSADIQGALGVSSDYMTWVSTAFNAANMFIGPLTVFLGGILGARRVLLWAGTIFMLAEFLSPIFGHNQIVLVVLQVVAGLAAGTYYPLTFTMIIRNFSMKYLHMGVAIYALDILASTHFAHFIESFYITNLGWQWLFWNALLVTPIMMLCIYRGIPSQSLPPKNPQMHFAGFLYAACALTSIYIALDQAQRLDWFHSPLICAFAGTGLFFLAITIVSRAVRPISMINLRFLWSRNFLLLGAILTSFRFIILVSTLLVPGYLGAIHGYRPEQTADVLAWVAVPTLFLAPLSGLLLYKVDSRLICAIGFALVGISCVISSQLDTSWTGETFFATQLTIAAGLACGLTGLVTSLLRSAMAAGALKNPVNILTISCWFQTCRLFGAEVGKTFLAHFLKVQGDLHYSVLSAHINGDWLTAERLAKLSAATGTSTAAADGSFATSAVSLGAALKGQVALLSYSDGFILVAIVCVVTIVAIGCVSYTPPLVSTAK